MLFTKQAVRGLCMKLADDKAANSEKNSTLPSLPVAVAVKQERESDDNLGASTQELQMKKLNINLKTLTGLMMLFL